MRFLLSFASSLCLLISSVSLPVFAQPSGAIDEHFIYLVESGDTLSDLSELFTNRSMSWRRIKELNQVPNEMQLAIGKKIKIPFSSIPVIATEASVVHFKGQVWINNENIKNHQLLKTNDVIRTGANGFATLKFEDQSTLILPNNSQLKIKKLNAFERTRLVDTILELQEGSVETQVAPNKTGVGRFEIHTPQSITGVRGTNLRVHTTLNNTSSTELLIGQAHLQTAKANYQDLLEAQGASVGADGSYTISPLLPAPMLTNPIRGKQGWQSTLTPLTQADHYIVQIALEPNGSSVVHRYKVDAQKTNTVLLKSNGPGIHYAFIRAVDKNGLMGLDARVSFPGQSLLVSSNSLPVVASDGQPILLTDY